MQIDLLNLLLVLFAAWSAGKLAARLGMPAVLGELIAGIVLGPPLLGILSPQPALQVLAQIGVLTMMLYIGMEIDPRELKRASWGGLLAALGGFLAPAALCLYLALSLGESLIAALFIALAAGVTSLATKSRILSDLNFVNTRIGHVMMAGALVTDVLCLVAFSTLIGAANAGGFERLHLPSLLEVGGRLVAFFALSFGLNAWIFPRLGPWLVSRGLSSRTSGFTLVLLFAVAFAELAEVAGLHGLVGAFVAGLSLQGRTLGRQLTQDLRGLVHDVSIGFLAPIFFVTIGFAVSFEVLRESALPLLALMALATVGKILGTLLFYLPTRHGWREGLVIGMGMNDRGAVEIILAGVALEAGIIDARIFSMLVSLAITTTATVPALLRWGVDWLRRRGELVTAGDSRTAVVIVGAGRTARVLGTVLSEFHPICLVDTNAAHCDAALADGLDALQGDALHTDTLEKAGANEALMVIAMTPNSSVNVLVAQLARERFKVPEVHVLHRDRASSGLTSALRHLHAKNLFGGQIPLEKWDRWLSEDAVDSREITGSDPDTEESTEDDSSLILAVRRDGMIRPYDGASLHEEDGVILLTRKVQR